MNQDSKARIVERITKLMKLAGNNSNESEVASALAMARRLMAEHDIEEAELDVNKNAEENSTNVNEVDGMQRKGNVERMDELVAKAVSLVCSTQLLLVRSLDMESVTIKFIGFPRDIAVSKAMFDELRIIMRTMARVKYGKQWSRQHKSYGIGFGERLLEKALDMKKHGNGAEATGAIVLAKDAAIERWTSQRYAVSPRQPGRSLSSLDPVARNAGREDANTIGLSPNALT